MSLNLVYELQANYVFDWAEPPVHDSKERTYILFVAEDPGPPIYYLYLSYSDNGVTWTTILVDSSAATIENESVKMALDSHDHLHIVYTDTAVAFLKYRTFIDNVLSPIDFLGSAESPLSMDIDSQDNLHIIICRDEFGTGFSDTLIYRFTIGGVLQADQVILTNPAQRQDPPTLIIDNDGVLHVIWAGLGWGVNVGNENIQYIFRQDGAWSAQYTITDDTFSHFVAPVTSDGQIVYFVTVAFNPTLDLYYRTFIRGVGVTSYELFYSDLSAGTVDFPELTQDRAGNLIFNMFSLTNYSFKRTKNSVWQVPIDLGFDTNFFINRTSTRRIWPTSGRYKNNILNHGFSATVLVPGGVPEAIYYYVSPPIHKGNIVVDQLIFQNTRRIR